MSKLSIKDLIYSIPGPKGIVKRLELLERKVTDISDRLVKLEPAVPTPAETPHSASKGSREILDVYEISYPSAHNALNIFAGEWSSILTGVLDYPEGGPSDLFNDGRIHWLEQTFGKPWFEDKSILELGPLEAGHTSMLEALGTKEIVAIEANTRHYLKCLVIKELLNLKNSRFLCGDFVEYLKLNETKFDLILASGVLYHMRNPVELIKLMADHTDIIFLWTHYFDGDILFKNPANHIKYPDDGVVEAEYEGFKHTLHRQYYGEANINRLGYCGGSAPYSHWLERQAILDCLKYFGYSNINISFDHPDHPNGPAFTLLASR